MNISEEQLARHAHSVLRKKERIDMLEALLQTHQEMGAEPDSHELIEIKERLKAARMQLSAMR